MTLELGGKSPNIVFADSDIDNAVKGAITGIFYGKGEVCNAGSRLFVESKVQDEFLEKLATVMRDRFRIKGKIRTLTAEGRFQALVLLAMPPLLMLALMVLNPGYGRVLLEHWGLLVGMFVSEAFGALWIWRIVNFDF